MSSSSRPGEEPKGLVCVRFRIGDMEVDVHAVRRLKPAVLTHPLSALTYAAETETWRWLALLTSPTAASMLPAATV